jgi:hypothetical protein
MEDAAEIKLIGKARQGGGVFDQDVLSGKQVFGLFDPE